MTGHLIGFAAGFIAAAVLLGMLVWAFLREPEDDGSGE